MMHGVDDSRGAGLPPPRKATADRHSLGDGGQPGRRSICYGMTYAKEPATACSGLREIGTRVLHDLLGICRPLGRELEREGRAAACPARGSHHSPMALDDRFDDRQTEATAGRVPGT